MSILFRIPKPQVSNFNLKEKGKMNLVSTLSIHLLMLIEILIENITNIKVKKTIK